MGAHKAIQGASIVLYRVGIRGYGSPATVLGSTTTDAAGAWAVSFTKPTDDPLVYVVAGGGNLGGGANEAIGLLTAIGPLSQAPNRVTVNEVTTVASVFALAQFLDRDTATNIGSAVANTTGLPNAFGNVGNLVDVTSGVAFTSPDAFTPIVNPLTQASEAPPGRVIDSLAELIAACIGSSGSTSMNCSTLFGLTTPEGGPVPTNTRQAIRNIALHPESRVTALYDLSRTAAAMFTPDLDAAVPNDWTLAINFTGGALAGSIPLGVAIDAAGDAWVTNQHCVPGLTGGPGCVIELHPQGSQAGPFPRGIGLDFSSRRAGAIAVGTNPNSGQEIVWAVSTFGSALHGLDAQDGGLLFGGALTSGLRSPLAVATDLLGNVWVANSAPRLLADGSTLTSLIEFSPGSANDYSVTAEFDLAAPAGAAPPSFAAIALDSDSPANIFVTDTSTGRIVQLSGATPGVQNSPAAFISPGSSAPGPLAVDVDGNVWAADETGGTSELLKGVGVPGFVERDIGGNTIFGPGEPGGIAIDGAGNAWISNTDAAANKGVVELGPSGVSISGLTSLGGYNGASPPSGGPLGLAIAGSNPRGIAIDSSGNVWVATGEQGGVVELVGAATPVRTPLNTRAALP
jgi:hypothetical protein